MAKNKKVLRITLILVAAVAAVVAGIVIYLGMQGSNNGYPDFTKTVYINCSYSNLKVDVTLNPDNTCEYKVSNDNYPFKGEWKFLKQDKAIEIDINLAHEAALGGTKTVKGTILLYDSKGSKSLAAIPFDAMGMEGGRIYGKWKQ